MHSARHWRCNYEIGHNPWVRTWTHKQQELVAVRVLNSTHRGWLRKMPKYLSQQSLVESVMKEKDSYAYSYTLCVKIESGFVWNTEASGEPCLETSWREGRKTAEENCLTPLFPVMTDKEIWTGPPEFIFSGSLLNLPTKQLVLSDWAGPQGSRESI